MNYAARLEKMDAHLREHPKDYQTRISRMKMFSEAVESERRTARNERLARLAEVRRIRREKKNGEKSEQ